MAGLGQANNSAGGTAGELDGQNFGLGATTKDQRASKDNILKMTRNKRQGPAAASKTPGGAAIKSVSVKYRPTKVTFALFQCQRKSVASRNETIRCWSSTRWN